MKMISGYLGPDLKVEGDVESKESIRIDGEYKGNIIVREKLPLDLLEMLKEKFTHRLSESVDQ